VTYYGQGLGDVSRALHAIAKAMEKANQTQGTHINYNIIVNVGPETDREEVANSVVTAIEQVEAKRALSSRRNY
jgi:hypothetical protein